MDEFELYRQAFERVSDAVFIHDYTGKLYRVNETASRMLGYSREALLAMNILEIDATPSKRRLQQFIRELEENGELRFETEHVLRGGGRLPVEVHASRITLEGEPLVLAIVRNIEERKLFEESLRGLSRNALEFISPETEEQLYPHICRRLADELPEAMVLLGKYEPEPELLVVRGEAGLGEHERTYFAQSGVVPETLFYRPDEEDKGILMDGRVEFVDGAEFMRRKLGFTGLLYQEFTRFFEGKISCRVGIAGDRELYGSLFITYRGEAREWRNRFIEAFAYQTAAAMEHQRLLARLRHERRRAEEANTQKSMFLAGVSHEIRTPLNSVLGYTDILAQHLEREEERGYVDSIKASGTALLSLVDDILDLSKIEAGRTEIQPEPLNLRSVFEEVYYLFREIARSKGIELAFTTSTDLPDCYLLDRSRLRQIMINLVGNAMKYTDSGEVRIGVTDEGKSGNRKIDLRIDVHDTGAGIDPKLQQIIFEPYRRGSEESQKSGVGLGLAIVRQLVNMMGGTVEVKSLPGAGSTFTVHLYGVALAMAEEIPETELAGCDWWDEVSTRETQEIPEAKESRAEVGERRGEEQLPEESFLMQNWRQVKESGSFGEIAAFAGRVEELGKREGNGELAAYGRALASLVERFDVVRLREALERFPSAAGTTSRRGREEA